MNWNAVGPPAVERIDLFCHVSLNVQSCLQAVVLAEQRAFLINHGIELRIFHHLLVLCALGVEVAEDSSSTSVNDCWPP